MADGAIVIEPVLDFLSLQGVLGAALPREEERAAVEEEAVRRARARG